MLRSGRFLAAVCLFLLIGMGSSMADIPNLIHFQGVLEDGDGTPLDGSHSLTFAIYDVESGGTALWSEMQVVDCDNGLFTVTLGSTTPIDLSFSEQYWLGCQVSGDQELSPRYRLASSPYAFWSVVADSAKGMRWGHISGMPAGFADGTDDVGQGISMISCGTGISVTDSAGPTVTLSLDMGHGNGIDADMVDGEHASAFADADHDHDDDYYTENELNTSGTINNASNPVDWTKLKNVPSGFADGSDDTGGGSGDGHSLDAADGDPADVVYVGNDGVVSVGVDGTGHDVNFYGAESGGRLFWDEDRMALRVGRDVIGSSKVSSSMGLHSAALGFDAAAPGDNSIAAGENTAASGDASTATGYYTTAGGTGSIAMGYGATATHDYSTAMGFATTAGGNAATAMGKSSSANGSSALAAGYSTTADGEASTALGGVTTASGAFSTAMGVGSAASGYASVAMGDRAAAPGWYSLAMGRWVRAGPAQNTIVLGSGASDTDSLINNTTSSLMVGFNTTQPTLFVGGSNHYVGIGTADPSAELEVSSYSASPELLIDRYGTPVTATLGFATNGSEDWSIFLPQSRDDLMIASSTGQTLMDFQQNGTIGIGTYSPTDETRLHIEAATDNFGVLVNADGTSGTEIGLHAANSKYSSLVKNAYFSGGWFRFDETSGAFLQEVLPAGDVQFKVAGSGSGAITWTRALTMETSGDIGIGTTGSVPRRLWVNGDAGGTTAWYNDSDENLKKNIASIPDALQKVQRLRGVNFEWKHSEDRESGRQMGFIAQEAVEIIPEVVSGQDGSYAMQYAPITALLVEAVKEQQRIIEMQREIIKGHEKRLEAMEAHMSSLR